MAKKAKTADSTPAPKKTVLEAVGPPRAFFINKGGAGGAGGPGNSDPLLMQQKAVFSTADGEMAGTNIDAVQGSKAWVTPSFSFEVLERRVHLSSILPPLVDAMEANVDGTGWELLPKDPEADKEAVKKDRKKVEGFFNECWPGESFTTVRKKIRRNYEDTGNAALEVLRGNGRKVTFARWLDIKTMRMLRLDNPVMVEKTVERGGTKVMVKVLMRERRFIQIPRSANSPVNPKEDLDNAGPPSTTYFKEFGATRDLNKNTGEWAKENETIAASLRASEIIWFTNKPDIDTPYGLPRWISNVPSVVGGREAEEFNLQYFASGGVPPLLIIVSGGRMAEEAEKLLTRHFMSSGPNRHNAAIMEAYATGGDIDSPQNVKVTVERFGSERMTDSMFENYMAQCDMRIRRAFRLPDIFLGNAGDMSFATAFASYTVAEAQVFGPERQEFDEKINLLLMPELEGGKSFIYHSLPLAVRDVAQQLKGLDLLAGKITSESMIEAVSQITDISVRARNDIQEIDDIELEAAELGIETGRVALNKPDGDTAQKPMSGNNRKGLPSGSEPVRTDAKKITGIAILAEEATQALLNKDGGLLARVRADVANLPALDHHTFCTVLAASLFPEMHHDPDGARELAACTFAILAANMEE